MVAEHHPGAGCEAGIERAGGVGKDELFDPLLRHPADAGGDEARSMAFVEVDAAFHQDDGGSCQFSENEFSGVARDGRGGQAGFGEGDFPLDDHGIRQRSQS